MKVIRRKVDQSVMLGEAILLTPTDIDDSGIRFTVSGRMLGGPDDGASFSQSHDVQPGQGFAVGPMLQVTVSKRLGKEVELHIFHPPGIEVMAKEASDPSNLS